MQQKTLDQHISKSDNRDKFEQNQTANLVKFEPRTQTNSQTKSFDKLLNNFDFSISNHNLGVIKFKSFAALSLGFLCELPYIGCILLVAAIGFKSLATFSVKKVSNSQTILLNFILYIALMILSMFLINLSPNIFELSEHSSTSSEFIKNFAIFCAGIIGLVFGSVYAYLYYKELSEITNQKYFLLACYCFVGAMALNFTTFGIIFFVAYLVCEVFAWIMVQKIQITRHNYALF